MQNSKPQTVKRLVTCQGTIQLVTALSALASHEQKSEQSEVQYEDYLVIYDLYAPEGQLTAFVDFISRMARILHDWTAIVYVSPNQLAELAAKVNSAGVVAAFDLAYKLVGIESAHEIYLCRNWQFGNQLFINAYNHAEKICYGDSIGIYFSEAYFSSDPPKSEVENRSSSIIDKLRNSKQQLREKFGSATQLKQIDFDIGYFALPDILGEQPPMPIRLVTRHQSLTIFQKLSSMLDADFVANLRQRVGGRQVLIMMTSNFSEARRMSMEDEVRAYREFLQLENYPDNAVLIIKPHPRDSEQKIEEVTLSLKDLFADIIVLAKPEFFFAPFELFLLRTFIDEDTKVKEGLNVLTFSTACLSLALLFDIKSRIGFGTALIDRYFFPEYRAGRIRHENDLRMAVERITASV